jgi:hypothetical protein
MLQLFASYLMLLATLRLTLAAKKAGKESLHWV